MVIERRKRSTKSSKKSNPNSSDTYLSRYTIKSRFLMKQLLWNMSVKGVFVGGSEKVPNIFVLLAHHRLKIDKFDSHYYLKKR